MIRFGGLLALVAFGFWLYALFDSISAPRERIRLLPKPVWVIVIVVLNIVGTVLWFTVGRPRKSDVPPAPTAAPRAGWAAQFGRTAAPPRRPVAPDDDPEFLRNLRNQPRDEHPDGGTEHPN
jgi:Phospholipase_D-nuclease N-terminal